MPDKITNSLTTEQLEEFCRRAAGLKGPTLAKIKALAEEWGIEISLMSARTFRDGAFAAHLARLRRGKEMTEAILAAVKDGSSALDAAQELAAQELLDALTAVDSEGRPNLSKVSGIIFNLRAAESSRQDMNRKLEETAAKLRIADERVKKLEDERAEREQRKAQLLAKIDGAKRKGGLTKETLAQIEEAAGLL